MSFKLGVILLYLHAMIYDGNTRALETRDVLDFGIMTFLKTGRNPLIFRSYGNHCGFGGGGQAVDEIDQCCENHDNCYKDAVSNRTCPHDIFLYPTGYVFEIENGNITCRGGNIITRLLGLNACAQALCHCDKDIAECLEKHISVYNQTNKGFLPQILRG